MKDVQCYELFGGIALKNYAFLIIFFSSTTEKTSLIMAPILVAIVSRICQPIILPSYKLMLMIRITRNSLHAPNKSISELSISMFFVVTFADSSSSSVPCLSKETDRNTVFVDYNHVLSDWS